eukprot:5491174-Pyramimonas_sp.AAC.1
MKRPACVLQANKTICTVGLCTHYEQTVLLVRHGGRGGTGKADFMALQYTRLLHRLNSQL